MKSCFVFLLTLVFFVNAHAQWKKVYIPTVKDLYDIQVVGNVAFAAGNSSALLRSDDTGKSWQNLTLTIPQNIRAVCFIDTLKGFIIGENARIQKTYNGGKTWTQKYIKTAAYGYDMSFLDKYGVAIGKDMLAISSTDTGNTWTVDTTLSKFKKLNSVCIAPDGKCWAVGDSGYILSKMVTGKKWKISKYPTKVDLNHVSFTDDGTLIIAGGMPDSAVVGKYYNILLISTDTGKTWQQNTIGEMKTINSAYFKNKDTGFLAGSNGLISKCSGGVSNRGLQLTGTASTLNKIWFSDGIGMVAGDGGALYRTDNEGGKVLAVQHPETGAPGFTVYPNPGNGEFNVFSDNQYDINIIDMQGKVVYSAQNCQYAHPVSLPVSGIYNVLVQFAGRPPVNTKLIVLPK